MDAPRVLPGLDGTRFSEIVHVPETGSTNADLLDAARDGAPEGQVRVTDHQRAGRGRQSRAWHDEPGGSMLMSVLLRPRREVAALVPLIAGLAITDATAVVLAPFDGGGDDRAGPESGPPPQRAALKWPNDVLVPELGERKLAGILSEATAGSGDRLAVVAGMGLNLRWHAPPPVEIRERVATLEQLAGRPIDRWDMVRAVLAGIERWLGALETTGSGAVLDAYRGRCLTIGRAVRFQRQTDVIEGTAAAVTDDGALVIETADGPITVTAGDAHHL